LSALHLQIEGISAGVVGVMPDGFAYPARAEVWYLMELVPDDSGGLSRPLLKFSGGSGGLV
jgi:hypothetical protein